MKPIIAQNTALLATIAIATTVAPAALANPMTFFNSVPAGSSSFDTAVNNAGVTAVSSRWLAPFTFNSTRTVVDFGDYTVNRIDNREMIFLGSYGALTGSVTVLSPPIGSPIASRSSGLNFTFDNSVNAFGIEVGDWGTCCQPTSLYISFDYGAPILVASSLGNNVLSEAFVGAIDDSNSFSSVQFWGDGFGEIFLAGGTIRYADIPLGGLIPGDDPPVVPEPNATLGLVAIGVFAALARHKRR